MRELALNILDIAENSLSAGAKLVEIEVCADFAADRMSISIRDDGKGMSKEMLATVCDPFTTTRTTRKVGMGLAAVQVLGGERGRKFFHRVGGGEGHFCARGISDRSCRPHALGGFRRRGAAAGDDEPEHRFRNLRKERGGGRRSRYAADAGDFGGRHSLRRARSARFSEGIHQRKFNGHFWR